MCAANSLSRIYTSGCCAANHPRGINHRGWRRRLPRAELHQRRRRRRAAYTRMASAGAELMATSCLLLDRPGIQRGSQRPIHGAGAKRSAQL